MEPKSKICRYTVSWDYISVFPYSQLFQLKWFDYEGISKAVTSLKPRVAINEFYANPDNCLDYTLDFILTYLTLLFKNHESGRVLSSLLSLLTDIVIRVLSYTYCMIRSILRVLGMKGSKQGEIKNAECIYFYDVPRINSLNIQIPWNSESRILSFLKELMKSDIQENYVKLVGGKLIIEMLHRDYKDLELLCFLSSHAANIFNVEGSIAELSRLLRILFEGHHNMNGCQIDMTPVIILISNDYMKYLSKETDQEILLEILNLYLTYFNKYEHDIVVIQSIKSYLSQLCKLMANSLLRKVIEELLSIIVEKLYCTDLVIWPGGRNAILNEISSLPDAYEDWPNVKLNIYFVIAHTLCLHSRTLWSYIQIKQSIEHYYLYVSSQTICLKAIIYLYPLVSYDVDDVATYYTSKILIETLIHCKSFVHLLTYHYTQIVWILRGANDSYKYMALKHWLNVQSEDHELVNILNEYNMGYILVKLLVTYADVSEVPRIIGLIKKLKPQPNVQETLQLALLASCNNPVIFNYLFEINLEVPTNLILAHDMLKMLVMVIPFLHNDASMQAACYYTASLLDVSKKKYAISTFSRFPATIRYLVAESLGTKEENSVAAISLLKDILIIQIRAQKPTKSTIIPFSKILHGHTFKVSLSLKLLQLLLTYNNQHHLISICEDELLQIYYLIHAFTTITDTSAMAFEVLYLLILKSNNLVFSLVTTNTLLLICNTNIQQEACNFKPFLKFLEEWLKRSILLSFIQVPVRQLQLFLYRLPNYEANQEAIERVAKLLDTYGRSS